MPSVTLNHFMESKAILSTSLLSYHTFYLKPLRLMLTNFLADASERKRLQVLICVPLPLCSVSSFLAKFLLKLKHSLKVLCVLLSSVTLQMRSVLLGPFYSCITALGTTMNYFYPSYLNLIPSHARSYLVHTCMTFPVMQPLSLSFFL